MISKKTSHVKFFVKATIDYDDDDGRLTVNEFSEALAELSV